MKEGSKAYRRRLRTRMRAWGIDEDEIAVRIAHDLIQYCKIRPRAAWRMTRELTLEQAATRFNGFVGGTAEPVRAGRIWDYEQWPRRGTKPSMRVLEVLSGIYGTTIQELVDIEDLACLSDAERADYRHRCLPRLTGAFGR
jgi:hypothetical protein